MPHPARFFITGVSLEKSCARTLPAVIRSSPASSGCADWKPRIAHAFARCIYIHGTPEEKKIGRPASYGCIRMKSKDVAALYSQLPVGAVVQVVPEQIAASMRKGSARIKPLRTESGDVAAGAPDRTSRRACGTPEGAPLAPRSYASVAHSAPVDKFALLREPPRPEIFFLLPMANTKSASKRARQTAVRSLRNRRVLTRLRKMQKPPPRPRQKPETRTCVALISAVDKAAKRGIIHRNAANRRKAA